MKEPRFIRRNKDKWEEFERSLTSQHDLTPDRLSDLYLQLMDDLSYARTHYPKSKVVRYLNQLAVRAHRTIYGTRRESSRRLITFFTEEVPQTFLAYRRYMLWSALVFSGAILIGILSTLFEPEFTRTILGDSYVNMTIENIEKGDPMAVYKSMESGEMFRLIAINNIRVAILMYVVGIFAGVPTILLLLTNGVMVGTFMQYFVARGLGWTAFSTVFLHGALELTAIVIVGGCGLLLGSCALFPGTFARAHALVRGARDSLKLVLGIIPFIVLAALIEGYVTRMYQDLSGGVRLAIILGSLAALIWYCFIYPLKFKTHAARTI